MVNRVICNCKCNNNDQTTTTKQQIKIISVRVSVRREKSFCCCCCQNLYWRYYNYCKYWICVTNLVFIIIVVVVAAAVVIIIIIIIIIIITMTSTQQWKDALETHLIGNIAQILELCFSPSQKKDGWQERTNQPQHNLHNPFPPHSILFHPSIPSRFP